MHQSYEILLEDQHGERFIVAKFAQLCNHITNNL